MPTQEKLSMLPIKPIGTMCPMIGYVCMVYCPYGYAVDANGNDLRKEI